MKKAVIVVKAFAYERDGYVHYGYEYKLRADGKEVLFWNFCRVCPMKLKPSKVIKEYLPKDPWKYGKTQVLEAGLKALGYEVQKCKE